MAALTRTNALYEWVPPADGATDYSVNGLNQLTAVDAQAISHDGRGNVTGDGASSFAYNVINQLTQVVKAGVTVTLAAVLVWHSGGPSRYRAAIAIGGTGSAAASTGRWLPLETAHWRRARR